MVELVLAGAVLAVCVALLLRLVLPVAQRRRIDATGQRAWWRLRWTARQAWSRRSHRRDAERVADEAIRRARRRPGGQSHMVSPDAAKGPRKPH